MTAMDCFVVSLLDKGAVIVRLDRTIQYAAAARFSGVSAILDRPLEPVIGRRDAPTRWRAMTGGGLRSSNPSLQKNGPGEGPFLYSLLVSRPSNGDAG